MQHDYRCLEVLGEADCVVKRESGVFQEVRSKQDSFDLDFWSHKCL